MYTRNKIPSLFKILLGILFVIGGFPALINGLFITIRALTGTGYDSYNQGRAFGNFAGVLIVWVSALWLAISGSRERKRLKG